jgi:O-antigen/teichoic acid export membrane protein
MDKRISIPGYAGDAFKRWAVKGGISLADQGLYSGASFIVGIIAARWLQPEDYGAFTVGYSIFLFLASLYTAVLLEPMTVFGAGAFAPNIKRYFGILIYAHIGLSIVLSGLLVLLSVAMRRGAPALANALGGLAATLPFLLLFWLVRRGFYIDIHPQGALGASALMCAAVFLILVVIRGSGWYSSSAVFFSLGLASLVASCAFLPILRPDLRLARSPFSLRTIACEHFRYGSWNALATCFYWASSQIIVMFIPPVLGLGANATLAAVSNIFRPLSFGMQSITLLLLPTLSSRAEKKTRSEKLVWRAKRMMLVFAGAAALYGLMASLFSNFILNVLYAGKYSNARLLVTMFALTNVASVIIQILTTVLKAHRNTRSIVPVWIVSTVVVTVFSVPAMKLWGLEGAVSTLVIGYSASAVIAWVMLKRTEARLSWRNA